MKIVSRTCQSCSKKTVPFSDVENNESINLYKWESIQEKRISAKTKKEIIVRRMIKKKVGIKVHELKKMLLEYLPEYFNHILRVEHQQKVMQDRKNKLTEKTCCST